MRPRTSKFLRIGYSLRYLESEMTGYDQNINTSWHYKIITGMAKRVCGWGSWIARRLEIEGILRRRWSNYGVLTDSPYACTQGTGYIYLSKS